MNINENEKVVKNIQASLAIEGMFLEKDNIDLIGDFKMRDTESGEREPYYNFGENKGRSIEEVGPGMLEWMIYKKPHNYPADTIHAAEKLLEWLNKKADKKFMERKEQENKSGKHWYD